MASRLVLLIHGVNSHGEWHDTTIRECRGLFECVPLRYRHYHGLTGALKVYVWPTALSMMIAISALIGFGLSTGAMVIIRSVLIAVSVLAVLAEFQWTGVRLSNLVTPLTYVAMAILVPEIVASTRITAPLAALVGVSIYLDCIEYGLRSWHARVASLVVAVATGFCFAWLQGLPGDQGLWIALAALCVLAVIEPYVRRACAFGHIKRQIDAARTRDPIPHVVAHSLGTYITGHLLNEDDQMSLGRVIFTGCVLDRRFPWHENVGLGTPRKCWAVKNYVGGLDFVPILTSLLRAVWVLFTLPFRLPMLKSSTEFVGRFMRWRPLGAAGQRGFSNRDGVVHSQDADVTCEVCAEGARAVVHNVKSRFSGHSTINQDADYQCFQWLPFLWGDSPDKFDYWKGICWIGHEALVALEGVAPGQATPEAVELRLALHNATQRLLAGPWYWPLNTEQPDAVTGQGRPMRDYVEQILNQLPGTGKPSVEAVLQRVPTLIFIKFAEALTARQQLDANPLVTGLLEPRRALIASVCEAAQF